MEHTEPPKIVMNAHRPEKWDVARRLRAEMTDAERTLWQQLRMHRFRELKFRRQQIMQGFIVDFYCHEERLAIEVDGGVHEAQREYDAERTKILARVGVRVVRVTNTEVLSNMGLVLARLREATEPSPASRSGRSPMDL